MIITKELLTSISHLNILYYKSIGFTNAKCNTKITVTVDQLPKESNLKIEVQCDICKNIKYISYQKYNKNILKYNIYSCSTTCSQSKIKKTNLEKYGDENYVNIHKLKETVKFKYDIITNEIINIGYIKCIKCFTHQKLCHFLIKNGRYKHICRSCRNIKHYENLNKNPHIKAWRSVLKGYIERTNMKKSDRTFNLLKYSPKELKEHISSLFNDSMTWDNYGEWHIDHIVHVSLFKSDTPCYIVNELSNLRPLSSSLNISRHNNLDNDCLLLLDKYKTYIKEEYITK